MRLLIFFVVTAITLSCAMSADVPKAQVDSIRFRSMSDPGLDSIIVAKGGSIKLTAKDFVLNYYLGPSFFFKTGGTFPGKAFPTLDETLAKNNSIGDP